MTLEQLRLSAKIDYITIDNPVGRTVPLPPLDGKLKWSRRYHFRRFTVHDPSPRDISTLISVFGCDIQILEMEVAVDFRPSEAQTDFKLLGKVMVDVFGRRLCPSAAALLGVPRRAYRPHHKRVITLKNSPCMPDDQLLIGARHDQVQVKCYLKRSDQLIRLSDQDAVARVEVRLGKSELTTLGLVTLICVHGFQWRSMLSPYFRHRVPQTKDKLDGERSVRKCEVALNNRIGQALTRLEHKFRTDYDWERLEDVRLYSRKKTVALLTVEPCNP